jgi:signal transduction histidine kinase
MTELAGGNLDVALNSTEQEHEIGKMARALEVFKLNAKELRRTLEKERELNGLQRQFVSMVSHEFRTPLAIIDGHAQRLERRPDKLTTERILKTTKTVRKSVMRLTELMESVLNAARMEDGRIQFQPAAFDLKDMVADICRSYGDIDSSHDIDMDLDGLPEACYGDVKLLRQVVSNLLSNAIKYSPEKTTVFVRGNQTEEGGSAISVRDEGVGIPSDELEQLSERFFRASTSVGIPGTGIGLHLVKQFVALHDGDMAVKSVVGQGTTFEIRLPAKLPNDNAPSETGDGLPSHALSGYEAA